MMLKKVALGCASLVAAFFYLSRRSPQVKQAHSRAFSDAVGMRHQRSPF